MEFFTSDTHWGHKNIIQYSNRPFKDVKEMNRKLIENWNSVVRPEDEIYHLGDFSFLDVDETDKILKQLNGRKHFIRGNHDKVMKKNKVLLEHFESVSDLKEIHVTLKDGTSQHIVMCHYPMVVWNKSHRGSWMLHGHCHGNLRYPMKAKIMDVGVDPQNYFPVSSIEVARHMASKETEVLDHHGLRT